ncbi:hypothetical protein D3Z58_12300 [Clostridiaceae bacterium]|nr:hypothetical protein [Clostridiaceae bacterium]
MCFIIASNGPDAVVAQAFDFLFFISFYHKTKAQSEPLNEISEAFSIFRLIFPFPVCKMLRNEVKYKKVIKK